MGVGILAKRVVLELGSSTNFVYSLKLPAPNRWSGQFLLRILKGRCVSPGPTVRLRRGS